MEHHISERSLAIARAAFPEGREHLLAGPLPIRPDALRQVEAQLVALGLGSRRIAVLHYGTTWPTKLWSADNWQELVHRLVTETELVPVLTWGSSEERVVVEMIAAAGGDGVTIWPRGSLPELAALLARAAVVVGGDTGPVHIAAAVDTPTVSIYRVTDGERNGPRGNRHLRLQAPMDCSPCLRKSCTDDPACAKSIGVNDVFSGIMALTGRQGLD